MYVFVVVVATIVTMKNSAHLDVEAQQRSENTNKNNQATSEYSSRWIGSAHRRGRAKRHGCGEELGFAVEALYWSKANLNFQLHPWLVRALHLNQHTKRHGLDTARRNWRTKKKTRHMSLLKWKQTVDVLPHQGNYCVSSFFYLSLSNPRVFCFPPTWALITCANILSQYSDTCLNCYPFLIN